MFVCKFLMKKTQTKARVTSIQLKMNKATVVDLVSSFLHSTRSVKDDREIVDIDFGLVDQGLIELTIKSIKKGG